MECLRSFSFFAGNTKNFDSTELNVWGAAPQNYWEVRSQGTSTYTIQGFKNINIYKIFAVGDMNSILNTGNAAIVNNWEFILRVNGNNGSIGNVITSSPNTFAVFNQLNNPIFSLSKFNPKIEFGMPIQGVTSIEILALHAYGIGAQNIVTPLVNLDWFINFVCYYNFEGEEVALL